MDINELILWIYGTVKKAEKKASTDLGAQWDALTEKQKDAAICHEIGHILTAPTPDGGKYAKDLLLNENITKHL